MEYFDLYDRNRRPLGRTLRRGLPMPAGAYHVVAGIWTANHSGQLLITLRDPAKESWPGVWENSGGAVQAGETSLEGARRELFEETGLVAGPQDLQLLGSERENSAFIDTYFFRWDGPLQNLTLQKGETCDARWATLPQLLAMAQAGSLARPVACRLRHLLPLLQACL